jgi:hypothetical protein
MGKKISQMDDEERRDILDEAYQHALALHEDGELDGRHPSRTIWDWVRRGRARDAAKDSDPDVEATNKPGYGENGNEVPSNANTGVPRAEKKLTADSAPSSASLQDYVNVTAGQTVEERARRAAMTGLEGDDYFRAVYGADWDRVIGR